MVNNGTIHQRMIINFIKNLDLRDKIFAIGAIVLIIAGMLALLRVITNTAEAPKEEQVISQVTILPVSALNDSDATLSLTGILRSKSEADLRTEVPGRITGVYAKVGNWVKRGTLIAEVENSAQKAQVTQALGALQAAKAQAQSAEAQLSKVQGGTREEQLRILQSALTDAESAQLTAQQSARNALLSAYATVNQSILHGTDTLFRNPTRYNPKVDFIVSDSTLRDELSAERVDIRYILDRHEDAALTQPENISAEIVTTITEIEKVKRFYDKLLIAIEKAVLAKEVSAAYAATVGPARSAMLAQLSSLTAANDRLIRSENGIDIAKANLEQGITGAQQEDVDTSTAQLNAANASVTSALGSYQAALAALEKTRIRATISGILSSFSARRGDFVNTQSLGRIVGNGGNEVIFNIPSTDKARLALGDAVLISGAIAGTITSISNSTDALTQQLEVRADLHTKPNVANGSVVSIVIIKQKDTDSATEEILVPINAIKFNADDTVMFTVETTETGSSILVALPVTLGDVRGSMVVVNGVQNDTQVVTDARGLTAGQIVLVK